MQLAKNSSNIARAVYKFLAQPISGVLLELPAFQHFP